MRLVLFEVSLAIGGQALQTRLDSSALPALTGIALNFTHFSTRSLLDLGVPQLLPQLLHQTCQHSVPGQNRSRVEASPALRAGVTRLVLGFLPVAFNTLHAVTMTTGNSHRILQHLQAHGAAKMVLLHRDSSCSCHF